MKELLVSLLLVTQFSCISKAQENDTTTQILTTDSLQTDTLSLLFAGDLMQHQGQINAARTATGGYDYSSYFEYVKDEICHFHLLFLKTFRLYYMIKFKKTQYIFLIVKVQNK